MDVAASDLRPRRAGRRPFKLIPVRGLVRKGAETCRVFAARPSEDHVRARSPRNRSEGRAYAPESCLCVGNDRPVYILASQMQGFRDSAESGVDQSVHSSIPNGRLAAARRRGPDAGRRSSWARSGNAAQRSMIRRPADSRAACRSTRAQRLPPAIPYQRGRRIPRGRSPVVRCLSRTPPVADQLDQRQVERFRQQARPWREEDVQATSPPPTRTPCG